MIWIWLAATLGWALALFYATVARARLAEMLFVQNMIKDALCALDPDEADKLRGRFAARITTDE